MKLKEFNPETCVHNNGRVSQPKLSISFKSGVFSINKELAAMIGLKASDQVVFHQDQDEPKDWFIEKVQKKGFPLRCTKAEKAEKAEGKPLTFLFNNSTLAHQIAASVEFKGLSGKCLVAGTPTKEKSRELWCILTGGLINIPTTKNKK